MTGSHRPPTDMDHLRALADQKMREADKRRTHSPITGKRYPKCSTSGCKNNVYANGKCYGHQR